jgi:hypothetical protein
MICTGIHCDADATNRDDVPIEMRACGELAVPADELSDFNPFDLLDPTEENVRLRSMWQIGDDEDHCTPTLYLGVRRAGGGGVAADRGAAVCPCAAEAFPRRGRSSSIRSASSCSPPSLTQSGARKRSSMSGGCGCCSL